MRSRPRPRSGLVPHPLRTAELCTHLCDIITNTSLLALSIQISLHLSVKPLGKCNGTWASHLLQCSRFGSIESRDQYSESRYLSQRLLREGRLHFDDRLSSKGSVRRFRRSIESIKGLRMRPPVRTNRQKNKEEKRTSRLSRIAAHILPRCFRAVAAFTSSLFDVRRRARKKTAMRHHLSPARYHHIEEADTPSSKAGRPASICANVRAKRPASSSGATRKGTLPSSPRSVGVRSRLRMAFVRSCWTERRLLTMV